MSLKCARHFVFAIAVATATLLPFCERNLMGQDPRASAEPCDVNSVYLKSGWEVPGIAGAITEQKRKVQIYPGEDGSATEAGVTVLRPDKELAITLRIYYFMKHQVQIRDQLVMVRRLYRFDHNGKVFAYGVRYSWAAKDGEKIIELGRETQVLYYDSSGDGVFDTMNQFAGFPFAPRVPK